MTTSLLILYAGIMLRHRALSMESGYGLCGELNDSNGCPSESNGLFVPCMDSYDDPLDNILETILSETESAVPAHIQTTTHPHVRDNSSAAVFDLQSGIRGIKRSNTPNDGELAFSSTVLGETSEIVRNMTQMLAAQSAQADLPTKPGENLNSPKRCRIDKDKLTLLKTLSISTRFSAKAPMTTQGTSSSEQDVSNAREDPYKIWFQNVLPQIPGVNSIVFQSLTSGLPETRDSTVVPSQTSLQHVARTSFAEVTSTTKIDSSLLNFSIERGNCCWNSEVQADLSRGPQNSVALEWVPALMLRADGLLDIDLDYLRKLSVKGKIVQYRKILDEVVSSRSLASQNLKVFIDEEIHPALHCLAGPCRRVYRAFEKGCGKYLLNGGFSERCRRYHKKSVKALEN